MGFLFHFFTVEPGDPAHNTECFILKRQLGKRPRSVERDKLGNFLLDDLLYGKMQRSFGSNCQGDILIYIKQLVSAVRNIKSTCTHKHIEDKA